MRTGATSASDDKAPQFGSEVHGCNGDGRNPGRGGVLREVPATIVVRIWLVCAETRGRWS
jgi:hypothetical protein